MIISDGTTDIEVKYADETPIPILEKSVTRSAGAKLKAQTGGERLGFDVRIRATAANYRSIMDLLTNEADEYYYTPEETHGIYSNVTFPLNVMITNIGREFDNRNNIWVTFRVESVDYL